MIRVDRDRYRFTSLTPSSSVVGLPAEERVLISRSSEGLNPHGRFASSSRQAGSTAWRSGRSRGWDEEESEGMRPEEAGQVRLILELASRDYRAMLVPRRVPVRVWVVTLKRKSLKKKSL